MYLLFVFCVSPAAVGTTYCASGNSKDGLFHSLFVFLNTQTTRPARYLTGFASNCVSTLCGNSCERSCLLILTSILEHVFLSHWS